MKRDTGFKQLMRSNEFNFLKWGQYMKRANIAERELELIEKKIEQLKDIIKIQSSKGNYNYSEYMHGMANGLICALSVMTGQDPQYMNAPEKWLKDAYMEKAELKESEGADE